MRLALDVCTLFSQVLWKTAQHTSDFHPLHKACFQKHNGAFLRQTGAFFVTEGSINIGRNYDDVLNTCF